MTSIVFFFLFVSCMITGFNGEDLNFKATTPKLSPKGKPNTFIGTTGDQIASSLLASKTPAMLWGSVPASAVTNICKKIVSTGRLEYTAKISGDWGGTESLKLKVVATGGCGAAPDSSGTQFVLTDNYGRKSAIVCPRNAGKSGCGVYMTGSDVNSIYKKKLELEQLLLHSSTNETARRVLLGDCREEAGKGAIGGAITGVLGTSGCLGLGPLAPFCIVGVLGVSAQLGAAAGCVSACFPGDATVQIYTGETKMMSQIQVGDKVGTLKNGKLAFSEIYAFGHQDFDQEVEFVNLETSDSKNLQLSPLHFLPTLLQGSGAGHVRFKRAQDIVVGDVLLAVSSPSNSSMLPCKVTRVSIVAKQGLFNPLTIEGTIVVNGVVASVHSDWFLDPLFDALGLTAHLPPAYQAILFPARLLYALLGRESYLALYEWLHARIDIAQFGTQNGGKIAAAVLVASGIASMRFLKKV